MAALVFSSLVALAALVVFALAVAWVRRSPPVGVAMVGLMLIPLWEWPTGYPTAIVTLSGMSLYLSDAISLLLFAVGVLEVRQLRANLRGWLFLWVLFGTLIAVALLRGVASFEPVSSVHEARPLLHFFWTMTWVLAVRPDRLRLRTISLVLGWVLVLVALYHAVKYGVGGASSTAVVGDGVTQTGRVLIAPQSMALLLCAATVFLGSTGSAMVRHRLYAVSSLVFGGVVVIAQNRSVWVAAALGTVAVLIWSGRRRARRQVFVQSVLGASVVLVAWSSGILGESQIADSVSTTKTYEWRTTGWQILISQAIARGPLTVVLGDPFGSNASLRRIPTSGGLTSVQAHNWYVTVFLYLGVIGLITLVVMLASALAKSRAMPAVCTFVLAAVAAYGWAYSVEWYLAPWLGAAITVALGAGRIAEGAGRIAEGPIPPSGLVANPNAARVSAGFASR